LQLKPGNMPKDRPLGPEDKCLHGRK